ncbi:MAG: hypothetical protein AUK47_12385 [Deltaproteobacteria bacterium CG2_30_63_29]|nr:MAG: hypothetical protein AUK47_12385 [Deltaproteobacteria bacterium CG2_30_63_29]PIV98286.1 MAG: hypothetical protein COW42_15585 [Deltaproteobacteria bacterium CG17_big_fil_post_rev_8_21_14_2_50_63_7]PJB40977.1 MAG: hypothetical protein CO108_13765 [Deltaproteobacteria bacterium CG_4_9_14_3_um_filter_63_12]
MFLLAGVAVAGCFETAAVDHSQSPCVTDNDCRSGFQCVALGEPYTYGTCVERQLVEDSTVDADTTATDAVTVDTAADANPTDVPVDLTVCGGQNVDLRTDVSNCGSCGLSCETPHTSQVSCVAARCNILECTGAHEDCDGNPANGCEIDTRDDPDHCGRCDHTCRSQEICHWGDCLGVIGSTCSENSDCASDHCNTLHNATFCTFSCDRDWDCGSQFTCAAGMCVPFSLCQPRSGGDFSGPACDCDAFCGNEPCQQQTSSAECN